MEAVEFGKENNRKIMLFPGSIMSRRQFDRVIPLPEKDCHVIPVSTDGCDGEGESTLPTSEASAEKLETYIRGEPDGLVDLVFGVSFGCGHGGDHRSSRTDGCGDQTISRRR